jgi:hypothetical protein
LRLLLGARMLRTRCHKHRQLSLLGVNPVGNGRSAEQDEPQRVLGQPIQDLGPGSRPDEPQRVMGYPVDSIGPTPADVEWFKSWLHPIRIYKRWTRRRRLGPYDLEP